MNKKGYKTIAIIVGVIVVIILGYFAFAKKAVMPEEKQAQDDTQTQPIVTTQTSADNSTNQITQSNNATDASLKAYQNTKYGFELQYPSTWKECDNNTLQKAVAQNSKNDKYIRIVCIYDSSFILQADTGAVKSVVFYVDESGQHGTFGTLRNTLQADHQRAINLGLYSIFAEKILGGRSF